MKLRSSRLVGEPFDVLSKQSALKGDMINSISAQGDSTFHLESGTSSSPSNAQGIPSLSGPEPAGRYNLRSRPETSTKTFSKHQISLPEIASLKIQKATKLRKRFPVSATGGPRTCPICVESRPSRQYFAVKRGPKCNHGLFACKVCVLRHISTELERHGRLDEVSCLDCKVPLGRSFISKMLSKVDMKRMRALAMQKSAEKNPRYRFCISPDCTAGQIHPRKALTDMVVCYRCDTKSCFHHGIPWHADDTCVSYGRKHPAVSVLWTSEVRLKAQAKKCPGPGCEYYVEKVGGCEAMRCTMCKHHWRWNKVKWGFQKLPEKEEAFGN